MTERIQDIVSILDIVLPGISWIIDGENIGVSILLNIDNSNYTHIIKIYESENAYIAWGGPGYYTVSTLSDDIATVFGVLRMFVSIYGVLLVRTQTGSFTPLTDPLIPQKNKTMKTENEELTEALQEFHVKLLNETVELSDDALKILNDNFWDLL